MTTSSPLSPPALARRAITLALLALLAALAPSRAAAAGLEAAKVIMASGTVESMASGTQNWQAVQPGATLAQGDTVRTGADGRAALLLADESIVRLNHDTLFVLQNVASRGGNGAIRKAAAKSGDRSLLGVIKGELWFLNKNPDEQVDIKTRAMTASLRGTEFDLRVEEEGTSLVSMLEGTVEVGNEFGALTLQANESALVRPGFAPRKRILLTPEETVQWTVLIPELLHYQELFRHQGDLPPVARLRQAWEAIDQGDLLAGRRLLMSLTADHPDFAPAWESLALASLLLHDGEVALQAEARAERLAPASPYPLMLRSLILQARFDLAGAEEAVRAALALEANNVTALIQLGTLLFGRGATVEARQVLDQALALAPESAEVNNLHGFILLALRQEERAALAFARAVKADPALAEPHLGLGLIAMRQGDETTAMTEVTAAVLLEPRRAMLRSYWAKMLHQLGRPEKALDVLHVSLHIDPRDPTPDLYRAIILRDLRQPGAAIAALNQAIRKNDNRAVYRSRLLLDRDLAVKNVDLSAIYRQLGLTNWSRVKAVASLEDDYTNSSAHLFYAGTLTGDEGRSGARNTEHLLSLLLMPANANSFNTFNDYTTFFERPSLQGEYSVQTGSNDTLAQEILAYGSLPRADLAFYAGYLPHRTEGWRPDFPEQERSAVSFVKWDPAPNHGLMFAAARTDSSLGGRDNPRFAYYDPPEPLDNQNGEEHTLECGYAYALGPTSRVLLHALKGQFQHREDDTTLHPTEGHGTVIERDHRALSQPFSLVQGELLHRHGRHQLIVGSSYYRAQGADNSFEELAVDPPVPGQIIEPDPPLFSDYRQDSWSAYLHHLWQPHPQLTLNWAIHNEAMNRAQPSSRVESHELTPRFGLQWRPLSQHTFRLAAFRSLLPFDAPYLAPTDIAGVPVLRNGLPGTVSDEGDLVWDYELGGSGLLSTTLFYLERRYQQGRLDEVEVAPLTTRDKGGSVVFEALLGERTGLTLSYRYDDIDNELDPLLDRVDHLLAAGLRWVGPAGWAAGISETNRFAALRTPARENDNIYLTDLFLEYEFPGKRGSLKFEVNNLFEKRFNWVVDTFAIGGRAPAREALLTLRLVY